MYIVFTGKDKKDPNKPDDKPPLPVIPLSKKRNKTYWEHPYRRKFIEAGKFVPWWEKWFGQKKDEDFPKKNKKK